MLQKILKFLNDNHWWIICFFLSFGLMVWTFSCESTVTSMEDPTLRINRDELEAEVASFNAKVQARVKSLDRQDAFKQQLLDSVSIVGESGTINASGLITLSTALGAIAFGLDRNKKLKDANKVSTNSTG